jgi:ribosomal protein S18 acetylase RimI-like enzyme
MIVRDRSDRDAAWITALLRSRWGGTVVTAHAEMIDAAQLPALVAGDQEGLATYRVQGHEAELVTLDAVAPGQGVGTHLIDALVERLRGHGVHRLWVTTTNDNLSALAFYQKRGFRLRHLRPGAVDEARHIKPSIPTVAWNGIPIREEIELCRNL